MATKLQIEWLRSMAPAAQMTQRKYGVPASVTLAQCITESAWGTSQLARRARNFFGIKAMQGESYCDFSTREVVLGRSVMEMSGFAVYPSAIESFDAHGKLLAELPRYKVAMLHKDNPASFAVALYVDGYSTNPSYALDLLKLVEEFNLTQYDTLPPDEPAQEVAA